MVLTLTLCFFLAFVSVVATVGLALALVRQGARIRQLESELRQVRRGRLETFQSALEPELDHPVMEGLRVGIFIQQDHDRPIFAQLLKDRLIEVDANPTIASSDDETNFDLVIKGSIACNGYAEAYYSADLDCLTPKGPVFSVTEKPPHGARQVNLANELVSRLKRELEEEATRQERQRAISQLRGEFE